MTRRVQLQPSFLLHRRPFRDSSQLLEVLTLDFGRLSLVARGVSRRRRGGSFGALLQPFRPLLLGFSSRSDLGTLTAAEPGGEMLAPRGPSLFSGLYVNELLTRLLHRDEAHPALFSTYGATLEALAADADPAPVLRRFEFALLEELGYGVELTLEAQRGAAVEPERVYRVDAQHGVSEAQEIRDGDLDLFRGAELLAIARGEVDGACRGAARRLARQLLAPHLGAEPLRARQLFQRQVAGTAG